jgi:hypothetical protein
MRRGGRARNLRSLPSPHNPLPTRRGEAGKAGQRPDFPAFQKTLKGLGVEVWSKGQGLVAQAFQPV